MGKFMFNVSNDFSKDTNTAVIAAETAAVYCKIIQNRITGNIQKFDKTPVTIADYVSQTIICKIISDRHSDDKIMAEETTAYLRAPENQDSLREVVGFVKEYFAEADKEFVLSNFDKGSCRISDRFWTIDPIDGTKGFIRKEQYCTAIALFENGDIKSAAVGCPEIEYNGVKGAVFFAERGKGAYIKSFNSHSFEKISLDSLTDENLRFVQSVDSGHGDLIRQEQIAKNLGIVNPPVQMDSQVKYCIVAWGKAALYVRIPSQKRPDYKENIWDHMPGTLIVEEAGGIVTDINGLRLIFDDVKMMHNTGIVAAAANLHEKVIKEISGK